jgi:hypothetical protein
MGAKDLAAIVAPFAAGLNELAGCNRRGMADDGDQIALAARLHPQDAEAVLVIMEGHALDEPGEDFRAAVGGGECGPLAFGQLQAGFALDPGNRLIGVDLGPRQRAAG